LLEEGDIGMDFVDKLSIFAKSAVDKTSDMIQLNVLKNKINSEEDKISVLKDKLAEHYFGKFKGGEELDEEAAELCGEIKDGLTAIEGFDFEIERIKNSSYITICPSCGEPIVQGVKYCSECGAKIE